LVTGGVTVSSGATLQLNPGGAITVAGKALTLNGTGFGNSGALPLGALQNQSQNNAWTGDITLTAGSAIGGASGTTLTLSGILSGTDLTKVGAGVLTL